MYEPFESKVVAGNVVSVDDQPDNGGAYVCRTQNYRLRFQPGLQCFFSDTTSGTVFQDYWQQFNYDNTFDHYIGVRIVNFGEEIIYTGGISSVTAYLCGFEPYVSGTIYSMEVLGQMNITVKALNEIEVTDPDLFEKLMRQYYYILKKITNSGTQVEKTFYKY